jgi:hypothetical protein
VIKAGWPRVDSQKRQEMSRSVGKNVNLSLYLPVWTTWRRQNYCLYSDSNSDPSLVQLVASRYTDWAIPARSCSVGKNALLPVGYGGNKATSSANVKNVCSPTSILNICLRGVVIRHRGKLNVTWITIKCRYDTLQNLTLTNSSYTSLSYWVRDEVTELNLNPNGYLLLVHVQQL